MKEVVFLRFTVRSCKGRVFWEKSRSVRGFLENLGGILLKDRVGRRHRGKDGARKNRTLMTAMIYWRFITSQPISHLLM